MTIDNKIFFALVEERLADGESVKIILTGSSMQPTLVDGDEVTLSPLHGDPAVGDVVLFRLGGQHILHRVVAVDGDRYTMSGDNCVHCEHAFRRDIVGMLTAVKKHHWLRHMAVRWLGHKGRRQLRPWYFAALAFLMWAPLNGVGIPLDNYLLGLRLDHLLHASVFIPCALFLMDLYRVNDPKGAKRRKWAVWLSAVAVGMLTEGVQWLLPFRGFDINDMVANFLGVSLGWAAILWARKHKTAIKRKIS